MYRRSSETEQRGDIQARIKVLFDSIKIQDIDNHGRHYRRVLEARKMALEAQNYTAVAASDRLLAQMQGALIDRSHVTFEASLSDDELVDAVAKGDGILAQAMRARLGSDKFDA